MTATRLPIRILRDRFTLALGLACAVLPMPAPQTAMPVNDGAALDRFAADHSAYNPASVLRL